MPKHSYWIHASILYFHVLLLQFFLIHLGLGPAVAGHGCQTQHD